MTAKARAEVAAVINAYDFSGLGTIADIGGGTDTPVTNSTFTRPGDHPQWDAGAPTATGVAGRTSASESAAQYRNPLR